MIRVGVIGCGLIGQARIKAIEGLARQGHEITYATFDNGGKFPSSVASVDALLDRKPDWVIVALPHDVAPRVAIQCLHVGCRGVLLEKPMGRNLSEANALNAANHELETYAASRENLISAGKQRLFVGMNYRFYPGVRRALQDARSGLFGDLISVDMVLGHGGKPGDEKTWKLDPARAGGGCLLDPGIHLLDLLHLLTHTRDFGFEAMGQRNKVWKTGIEEEIRIQFVDYETDLNATITSSIVRWRNTFRLELHGTEGYGIVEGRGGNYGPQVYRTGKRWAWENAGRPQRHTEDFMVSEDDCGHVFEEELRALFFPTDEWPGPCTSAEAIETMKLYTRICERLGL